MSGPHPYGSPELHPSLQRVPPRQKWNKLAIASVVLSILWLAWLGSLLGLIFGVVAHREIKGSRGRQRGSGLAIAGASIGAVGLVLGIVAISAPSRRLPVTGRAPHVAAAALHPKVAVVDSGFTESTSGASSLISYGVVLRDESQKVSALNVTLSVTMLDSQGRSLDRETTVITAIPAGATFYVGGEATPNVSLTLAKLNISVSTASSTVKTPALPSLSRLALIPEVLGGLPVAGFGSVGGAIANPYHRALRSEATIYVVYLNSQGQVVGGDSEPAGAEVEPGATVAFSLPDLDIGAARSVEASVDPCVFLGNQLASNCPVK